MPPAVDGEDLTAIGRHCQFEYCHQLDFLPFRCGSCHGTFCLEHRSETAHRCAHPGKWAAERRARETGQAGQATTTSSASSSAAAAAALPPGQKPTVYNSQQCSLPTCKTLIYTLQNEGVHCGECARDYCLKHRLREDHDCARLAAARNQPLATAAAAQTDKVKSAFARLRDWGKEKTGAAANTTSTTATATTTTKSKKANSPAARLMALNQLKKTAKGNQKLAMENRIYLHVEAAPPDAKSSSSSSLPSSNINNNNNNQSAPRAIKGQLFFDKKWSVGQILDDAARRLQVPNLNNRAESEDAKLRVFHVERGRLLDFSEKIGASKVQQGDTIALLRGVGPPVPDLINLE